MTQTRRQPFLPPFSAFARVLVIAASLPAMAAFSPALADDFERSGALDLSPESLRTNAQRSESLDFRQLEALPVALRDVRSPLLVVVTDQGNVARLAVSPEFQKRADNPDALVPVLVLKRFETRGPTSRGARAARGEEVWLFDGFGFDLDAGHVVPVELGADIQFKAVGADDGSLAAVGKAELHSIATLPPPSRNNAAGKPSEGRLIRPTDYAGTYQLSASGIWSGLLELKVDEAGEATGSYRSDLGGEPHPVSGKTAETGDHRLEFAIHFPRTTQKFVGWLWNEGKNVMAGSVVLENHASSFVAVREGEAQSLAATGLTVKPAGSSDAGTRRLSLIGEGEKFQVDDEPEPRPLADLQAVVAGILETAPEARIIVKAPGAMAFERVRAFLAAIGEAGAGTVELAP